MGASSEGWNVLALEGFLVEAQTRRNLLGISIEDWVVLQKSTFDVHANNEPHIAHTLYMEKATGRYLHKVFGKTIQDGQLDTPLGLRDLAQDIFEHSRVCQGFQDDVKVKPGITLDPGFHPYERRVVPNCLKLFKDPSGKAALCPNCTQAMHFDVNPLDEEVSDFDENFTHSKEENIGSTGDLSKIDVDESNTLLWSDDQLIKEELANDESNFDSPAKDDDNGETAKHLVSSKRTKFTEVMCSHKELANPKNITKGEEEMSLNTKVNVKSKRVHCNHCNKTFAKDRSYRNHRAFLRRPERNILCKDCDKAHYSFASLAEHIEKDHEKAAIEFGKYIQTPQDMKTMKKAQKCSACYGYFNGHVLLRRHRTLYHELGGYECTDCNQHFLTYYHQVLHNYNQHSRISPYLEPTTEALDLVKHKDGTEEFVRNGHVCPKCEKLFKRDGEWGKHMKAYHAWSIFFCEPCDEMCHYATDFLAHVKNFHSDKPEIKCPICSDVFCLKEGSEKFMTHFNACAMNLLKRNPGQCEKCGKNFSNDYLLQAHLKSHDGEEKYLCDKCDYGTNLKAVMQDHQRSHLREQGMTHDGDGNDLFKYCAQCPKKFVFQTALNRHIKHIHEGIQRQVKCQNCDAVFKSCSMLYQHKRTEHGFKSKNTRRGRRAV